MDHEHQRKTLDKLLDDDELQVWYAAVLIGTTPSYLYDIIRRGDIESHSRRTQPDGHAVKFIRVGELKRFAKLAGL